LPLYVFCGDQWLAAYLRPSNIGAAEHARAVPKLLVNKPRAAWPDVKVTVRGDSGSCRWRLMRWCDALGIGDALGLAKNPALGRAAGGEIARAERLFRRTGPPRRLFGTFAYAAASRDRLRRVIVKAEHNAQGADPRSLVTNVPGDPQALYDDVSCQRGEMGDRIKEQQPDPFADRTSCHRFLANQFRLLLSSAADVLARALRRTALAGTELAQGRVGTLRLRLFKGAARAVVSARRVVFHRASSYPHREVFRPVSERVAGRAAVPTVDGSRTGPDRRCGRGSGLGVRGEVCPPRPASRPASRVQCGDRLCIARRERGEISGLAGRPLIVKKI
jgi:hypothetical protein